MKIWKQHEPRTRFKKTPITDQTDSHEASATTVKITEVQVLRTNTGPLI